jgi:hypothetical protein
MSHTNDAILGRYKVILTVDTEGPLPVEIWSRPALCAEVKPFSSELYFPTAGQHGASFELRQLCKRPSTSQARDCTTIIHANPGEMEVSSKSVPEGSHHRLLLSTSSKPIDQSLEIQSCNTTSCATPAPPSPVALPVSPGAATVADSDDGSPSASRVAATAVRSITPTATGLIGDSPESPPLLGQKRGREEDPKVRSEGGKASKRRRVLASPRRHETSGRIDDSP